MPKIEVPAFSINVKQAIIDEYVVDYLGEMFNGFEDDTWSFAKRIDAGVEKYIDKAIAEILTEERIRRAVAEAADDIVRAAVRCRM